jgi:exopolysaccharide biosynthesis operon protein EpsL
MMSRSLTDSSLSYSLLALGISLLFIAFPVAADQQDTLNFKVGGAVKYDNNLFLTSNARVSDRVTTNFVGVNIDKYYSLQRVKVDLKLTDTSFKNNAFLDFIAKDYDADWYWSLTPSLTGTVSANRTQQLNDFRYYTNYFLQNIRTTENQSFQADFSPHGSWHLLGGFTRNATNNSQVFNEESDFELSTIDLGFKYIFSTSSAFTFMGHKGSGSYSKRAIDAATLSDSGFDDTEIDIGFNWVLTAKSKLDFNLGYVQREHDHFFQRDYSGAQGKVQYKWNPTDKLQFITVLSRNLASYQTNDASYARTDDINISTVYLLSSKIKVGANVSVSERTYLGNGYVLTTGRVDKERLAGINLEWTPRRSIVLDASVDYKSRSSNLSSTLDYNAIQGGLSASIMF